MSDGPSSFLPTEAARSLTPTLFQGPASEGSSTTAAAALEVSLSTFEEEEASMVATDGLAPLTPTAAPGQADTFVSVSQYPLTGEQRSQGPGFPSDKDAFGSWGTPTSGRQEAMEGARQGGQGSRCLS